MSRYFILFFFMILTLIFLNHAQATESVALLRGKSNYVCSAENIVFRMQQYDSVQQTEMSVAGFVIANGKRLSFTAIVGKKYSGITGDLEINYKTSSSAPQPVYLHIEVDEAGLTGNIHYKIWPEAGTLFLSPAFQIKSDVRCKRV